MIDFRPTETPLDTPVLTTFRLRGYGYVVDVEGTLFQVRTDGDDPDLWCWVVIQQL